MAQVSVTINGRNYRIACDDGQEAHLTKLAEYIDQRVAELVEAVGQIGDTRLMVMAGLLIADELSDKYDELAELKNNGAAAADTDAIANRVEALAARIETIAARLEDT